MKQYVKSSEAPIGSWVHENDDYADWYVCSNCGYGDEGELPKKPWYRYCPSCGSKMVR